MIGTKKRLQDFVMLLLSANGSEEYLTEIGIDVGPLAPQIGTLLFATIKEHEYINLYHLESFEESFKYLGMSIYHLIYVCICTSSQLYHAYIVYTP